MRRSLLGQCAGSSWVEIDILYDSGGMEEEKYWEVTQKYYKKCFIIILYYTSVADILPWPWPWCARTSEMWLILSIYVVRYKVEKIMILIVVPPLGYDVYVRKHSVQFLQSQFFYACVPTRSHLLAAYKEEFYAMYTPDTCFHFRVCLQKLHTRYAYS